MKDITEKAKEVATSIIKDFHDNEEALAVLEIVKVLVKHELSL